MNIYVTGATGVVRSQYGTFGLNVTTPKKAILQVVYSGADEALIYDDMPLVYHVESLDFSKELVTRADLVIVPSHHASDYVGLYRDTPPVIVPPGIDFAGSVTSDINGGYILWDGLTNEHLDLLRQVASLDRSHQYIVRFEDLPRMGSNVVTLPPSAVDRWNELISEAGVYVTSTHELHPPTLVRALLCGIPIVALDRGSLQHLVIHSTNGVMSPATADGVIHGINYCLQYRFVLGSNSRAIARGFDWSIVMPELASLYTKVCRLQVPPAVTVYLLENPRVSLDDWVTELLKNKQGLIEIVLCLRSTSAGTLLGHTYKKLDRDTDLLGGYIIDGVRVRVKRFVNYTPHMGIRYAKRDCKTKYLAYNRVGALPLPIDPLNTGMAYLEANGGIEEYTIGGMNFLRTGPLTH